MKFIDSNGILVDTNLKVLKDENLVFSIQILGPVVIFNPEIFEFQN